MADRLHNWADNYTFGAVRLHRPASLEQVQEVVRGARKAKAIGTRHSFNEIADTSEDLISVEKLNRLIALDKDRGQVTVEAGVRYGDLACQLQDQGFAVHNLASLPHISIAGACATATHGSGDKNKVLSASVCGLQIVKADGSVVELSRGDEGFQGAVVGLGALGVVTQVSLDLVPSFQIQQEVYEDLPLDQLEKNFDEIESSAYSVSLFTNWSRPAINQVWIKRVVDEATSVAPVFFGATAATTDLHPIKEIDPVNCTAQMGVVGAWHERLPHFRMDYTPSSGEELQAEYLIPRRHAVEAIKSVAELGEQISPLLHVTEIRTMAEDDLWMSPSYGQACVGIHFTWKKNWDAVRALLPSIEERLIRFEARPHWGKLFTMAPERFLPHYTRLPDFQRLVHTFDPGGKFRNAYLERNIFGAQSASQQ